MKRTTRKILINCVIIAIIAAGTLWLLLLTLPMAGKIYTNNAQVRQDLVPVSSRVQGFVEKVHVEEFQPVKKGDTLFVIEDSQYRLRVAQAQAALAASKVGTRVSDRNVVSVGNNEEVSKASIEAVRVRMENAGREYRRYSNLYGSGAVTKQELDLKETDWKALVAQYDAMKSQARGASLATDVEQQRLSQSEAAEAVAKAQLDIALLDLSYTVILSPCDGYSSRKMVSEGELVQPGMVLQKIVSSEDIWILANYRETQADHISVGDKATIKVDAIKGVQFSGEVIALSSATGAQYSPVPTDNSAGNFVKVEGRVPVKVRITGASDPDAMSRLRNGLNAVIKVGK